MKKCKLCPKSTPNLVNINHKPTPICGDCLVQISTFLSNQNQQNLFGEVDSSKKQPTLEVFLRNAESVLLGLGMDYKAYKFDIESTYIKWSDNGWRDGYNKPIIGWKSKFRSQIPYLKNLPLNTANQQKVEKMPVIKKFYNENN